jgi:hypothetical protein
MGNRHLHAVIPAIHLQVAVAVAVAVFFFFFFVKKHDNHDVGKYWTL